MRAMVLFDIDGTLLMTDGAGMRALELAGRGLFGADFTKEGVDFSGRLDPLIIHDLLMINGVQPTPEHARSMRRGYHEQLGAMLSELDPGRALPGGRELVARVAGRQEWACGVLTGNFPETGRIKLRASGYRPEDFAVSVWGDESPLHPPAREHLPAVAMDKLRRAHGIAPHARRVVIVGDTPHDVSCARANGCRCIGVTTGRFSRGQLETAGADLVLDSLGDVEGCVRAIEAMVA